MIIATKIGSFAKWAKGRLRFRDRALAQKKISKNFFFHLEKLFLETL
jgi:hypothetical protein